MILNMYQRLLHPYLVKSAQSYPVVTLLGPRQSGKSTLARQAFPNYVYVSLEDPDIRRFAAEDARGFLNTYAGQVIIDEVQRVPDLLSYIQTLVDQPGSQSQFILTGSQHFLLMERVTQSLAGRTRIFELLPLSNQELLSKNESTSKTLDETLFSGGYPRIHQNKLDPNEWLGEYFRTYVERDVRSLLKLSDLDLFERFIRLCAGRAGQLLNLSSLANDCGISQPTAQAWLSVLKASFIVYTLSPHFKNFSKRLIKSPKLYFYDTGLLCYLLRISQNNHLVSHPLRGSIFENWVITEKLKSYLHVGKEAPIYFWRDQKGHEVDVILDQGVNLYPIEIKSAATFNPDFIQGLEYFNSLQNSNQSDAGRCIYGGDQSFEYKGYQIESWRRC